MFSVIGHSDFDASPDHILTEDHNGVNAGTENLNIILFYVCQNHFTTATFVIYHIHWHEYLLTYYCIFRICVG